MDGPTTRVGLIDECPGGTSESEAGYGRCVNLEEVADYGRRANPEEQAEYGSKGEERRFGRTPARREEECERPTYEEESAEEKTKTIYERRGGD
ncbi:hypothetical protein NDU88_005017 [Pleurodeles waltl]|uniref:Uncharacterized protein n=1 Tax=Pleurodeles waltl TaxID=8319 RepID=A0AAV7WWF2_PLEWA|nr:hypothetical protein NDU88_005017 [Pleurodeles waltl]